MKARIRRALEEQARLAARVERGGRLGRVRWIGGADVAFAGGTAVGVIVVMEARTLRVVEWAAARAPATFPYVPGLLAFREIPVLRRAWGRLRRRPQLLMVDGHGVAHPRRCGLASHAGVVLGVPAIGVAKSLLCGQVGALGARRGSHAPIVEGEEMVGAAVRTRDGVRPVFVSVGHRVGLAAAILWVLATARWRLPEPVRQADLHSRALARGEPHSNLE